MNQLKRILSLLTVAVAMLFATAIPSNAKEKVIIGYLLDPSREVAFEALRSGKVTSDLIDVELRGTNIPTLYQAMATRQVDVFETGIFNMAGAAKQGVDFSIIGSMARYKHPSRGLGVWVRKDSPYQSIGDLKGKKIGVFSLNSTSFLLLRLALWKKYDVDVTLDGGDFELVELPAPSLLSSLATGAVEAATLSNLQSFQADRSGDYRMIVDSGGDLAEIFPSAVVSSLLLTYAENTQKKPEVYKELLRVLAASSQYARDNRDEVFAAVSSRMNVDPAFLPEWFAQYGDIPFTMIQADIDVQVMIANMAVEAGFVDSMPDIPALVWKDAIFEQ